MRTINTCLRIPTWIKTKANQWPQIIDEFKVLANTYLLMR